MYTPLSQSDLLDEWHRWATWVRDPQRDESLAGDLIGWQEFNWTVEDRPEEAWQAILTALAQPRMHDYLGTLAAGPLEDLLAIHGSQFIDRVESEARRDPRFASLLGGVWRCTMMESIWCRVQAVADYRECADSPRNES